MERSSSVVLVTVRATSLPAPSATFYWDVSHGSYSEVGPWPVVEYDQPSSFYVKAPATLAPRTPHCWTTSEIGLLPVVPPQVVAWEQEAARVTFFLDLHLLTNTPHKLPFETNSKLIWVLEQEQSLCSPLPVRPVVIVRAAPESLQTRYIEIVPYLRTQDPLLQHMTLMLQAALEGLGAPGRLYAESLADALGIHFLKRYAASQHPHTIEVAAGLSPYKLRRTTAYIKEHLEQELSVATLAAVAETSPAHFARLFKHTTGSTPHQYVLVCRMEQAKRLLTETDLPLSEVGLRVGCADQSHFTALFRKYVSLTPKAYRDSWRV